MVSFYADPLGTNTQSPRQDRRNYSLPATPEPDDPTAMTYGVQLGIRFVTQVDGVITAVKFWRSPNHDWTGTQAGPGWGMIWHQTSFAPSPGGMLLAQDDFPAAAPTDTGWLTCPLSAPVAAARSSYFIAVVQTGRYSLTNSLHSTALPYYGYDPGGFGNPSSPVVMGATVNSSPFALNGLYAYGGVPTFLTQGFLATGYYVDVVFEPD